MSEHAEVRVSDLYDRFLSAGVDGSLSKTAEAPSSEEVAAKVAAAGTTEGKEGKTKTENAEKAGEKLEQGGEESTIQEVTPESPEVLNTDDVPDSPGGTREESPKTIEKQASEVLEGVDEHVRARYEDEKLLRKYASEVVETMKSDMEKYRRQNDLSGLAGTISERINKTAASEEDETKEDSPKKDTSEETSESTSEAPVEDTAGPAVPAEPVEAAGPAVPAAGGGAAIPMEELPEDIRAEIETLVSDLSEQTGLPSEQVLEQLNQLSEEMFGDVSPEELTGELSKAAAEVEYDELSQRMQKLSAELGMDDTSEEIPAEASPEEAAGAETDVEGEDEMAGALLEGRSEEEIAALQEAVQELEAQGVPPEVIEEAAREVLAGDVPEEVTKVASDDDWNSLKPKQKVVGVLAYSLANAGQK